MNFMFEWEVDADRLSFDDSDRFEEDSLCSWISEPESLCNNWRGWKKQNGGGQMVASNIGRDDGTSSGRQISPLVELAAQAVACNIPFEMVEHFYPPIPEQLQLRIAFWSFPENEEDIRIYSCLANGSADEFQKGEHLFRARAVKNALQIGFHLSATLVPPQTLAQAKGQFNVAVVFDRRRITSCNCTCNSAPSWCAHVVALCLYRIQQANSVVLRAPVSESLSRLHREQLQKFAQYLISELPQQILPTAQRLLDELLSSQQTAINTVCGAPDPTAGPSASELTTWCLDEATLHENIKKTLIKFCVPSPIVFSDVNYLSSSAPPAAAEWQSLLRPLRGREPEGIWNLLSIVREMFRRNDSNAIQLLEILTEEFLACEQILIWWFNTQVSAFHNNDSPSASRGGGGGGGGQNTTTTSSSSQHAVSSLCDEIVTLWRLTALMPSLSPIRRDDLCARLRDWHIMTIDKVRKARGTTLAGATTSVRHADIELFSGFQPAIEACQLDWKAYPLPGVTYDEHMQPMWRLSSNAASRGSRTRGVVTSQLGCGLGKMVDPMMHVAPVAVPAVGVAEAAAAAADVAYSSSSEGFCDADRNDGDATLPAHDSDTDSGGAHGHRPAPKLPPIPHGVIVMSSDGPPVNGMSAPSSVNDDTVMAEPTEVVKCEQGDSQHSSDEYQVYFYDTKAKYPTDMTLQEKKKKADEPNYFAGIHQMDNKQDILFARAEALHAHGHSKEACQLAKQLAEDLLADPPDLSVEQPPVQSTKAKKKRVPSNVSSLASTTLMKASFLCNVLLEDVQCHHLAFQVGMFALELPRLPAFTKAMEVKLAYQESEMVTLLKRIPLGPAELSVIRDRAQKLCDGTLKCRGESLLPLTLASFIFDSLCCPASSTYTERGRQKPVAPLSSNDEKLGFDACVASLGLKANISEAEHPLLCEGTRRQRGELAITLLVHYKDDQQKLSKLMDRLLDKEVHQLFKSPSLASYLAASSNSSSSSKSHHHHHHHRVAPHKTAPPPPPPSTASVPPPPPHPAAAVTPPVAKETWPGGSNAAIAGLQYLDLQHRLGASEAGRSRPSRSSSGARPKNSALRYNSKDTDSSAVEEDTEGSADYKAWEAKFRCTNFKSAKKPSVGMASIDSSAPETTSSDNSPTLGRCSWGFVNNPIMASVPGGVAAAGVAAKHQGPGSDSGSSGKSSDSIGSTSSGEKEPAAAAAAAAKARDTDSPCGVYVDPRVGAQVMYSRSSTPNMKGNRYKNKARAMPTIPNQPSEASAHFMFELAKTVLSKAGGSSATSLFTQVSAAQAGGATHRALHVCAFQIGLYALGLHNCVSPNWLSRTYSSHVSWIMGQAMEIGSVAINILIDTWEGHLTPQEVATLADRASRGRDPSTVRAASELALSCLPHAQALNPNEMTRALNQCQEQSAEMLQQACLAAEGAAKGGGVYPEVLFDVARRWYSLYEESLQSGEDSVVDDTPDVVVYVDNTNAQPVTSAVTTPQQMITVPPAVVMPISTAVPAYMTPYSYMQSTPPFSPHYPPPHVTLAAPTYLATYPPGPPAPIFHHFPPPPPAPIHVVNYTPTNPPPLPHVQPQPPPPLPPVQPPPPRPALQPPTTPQAPSIGYLLSAYRVGMLAMETLRRRVQDDRPQAKYARNPPYEVDVKWLLAVALKLGVSHLQQFCMTTVNTVVSPFVLHDLAVEAALYLASNNSAQTHQHLRSPTLSPLIQRCLQMFIQCTQQRMLHITTADYDEFVGIVCSARNAFHLIPGGPLQFNELLQKLRRTKSCKKDLWQRIVNGLAMSSV